MATKIVSVTGGNWNSTTTWVDGVVPITTDDIILSATSGPLVVNIVPTCKTFICSGYTNTLTMSNATTMTVNGDVRLSSGMTISGSGAITVSTSATLTSEGKQWPNAFSLNATTGVYTLADNWVINGVMFFGGTSITVNGNQLIMNSGLNIQTANGGTIVGTTSLIFSGTGTWSQTTTAQLRLNTTINSIGTTTVSGNVYYNVGVLTYSAGTVITTGSTLNINASATLNTSGMFWNNVTIAGTSTLTLISDLNLRGTLTTQTNPVTISGTSRTVYVGGSLTINTTTSGTASIVLNGSGTWSGTGTLSNNININTTGTTTVNGAVYYSTGLISYSGGSVTTSGSSLYLMGSTQMLTSGVTWDTIVCYSNGMSLTLLNNLTTTDMNAFWSVSYLSSGGTLNVINDFYFGSNYYPSVVTVTINLCNDLIVRDAIFRNNAYTGTYGSTVNNNTVTVKRNITLQQNTSGPVNGAYHDGTTNFIWSIPAFSSGTFTNTNQTYLQSFRHNLTISGSGTANITGIIPYGGGSLTYVSGNVVTTGSTLSIILSSTLDTSGISWNNVTLNGTTTTTLNSDLNVDGTLVTQTGTVTISGTSKNVNARGNLTINTTTTGNVPIILNGSGSQAWTHGSAVYLSNNLLINKTGGTLNIGINVYYQTGTLTHTTGTVITTGSTLNLLTSTLDTSGVSWNNVTMNGTSTITLNSDINVNGTLTTQTGTVTINGNSKNTNAKGNLAINTTTNGTSVIVLNGTGGQTWSHGSAVYLSNNTIINKPSGTLSFGANIYYQTGTLEYSAGTVNSTGNSLTLGNSTTLNTSSVVWNDVYIVLGTFTLNSNFISTNLYSQYYNGAAGTVTFTGSTTAATLNVLSNLEIGPTTLVSSNTIIFNLSNNLNVNNLVLRAGSTSGNGYYTNINNFALNISGNLTIQYGGLNGLSSSRVTGTSTLNMIGNGTITSNLAATSSQYGLTNNININTTGTTTISGYFNYFTGTLTHTSGNVITTGSTLVMYPTAVLNTSAITWNDIVHFGTNTSTTTTLVSGGDLTANSLWCYYPTNFSMNSGLLTIRDYVTFGNNNISISAGLFGVTTVTLPNDLYVRNLNLLSNVMPNALTAYGVTMNGGNIYVNGNISNTTAGGYSINSLPAIGGTTNIYWSPNKSSSFTSTNTIIYIDSSLIMNYGLEYTLSSLVYFRGNITINPSSVTKFNGTLNFLTGTLNCNYGSVNAKNCQMNLVGNSTLLNINKVLFSSVTITSGSIITTNQFFNGSPDRKTPVRPSSSTNYTIRFSDQTEKFAKFVSISGATITNQGQLNVITKGGNLGGNSGIRFSPNQKPNGWSKNTPSVANTQTYGFNGIPTDPIFT